MTSHVKDGGHQGVYIGRAEHEGGKFPGTFLPALEQAFIAWGGKVHHKDHYEVIPKTLLIKDSASENLRKFDAFSRVH